MYSQAEVENLLFLDIETASQEARFDTLPERLRLLWEHKCGSLQRGAELLRGADELYTERAAIFAEFGKVVCISCGYIRFEGNRPKMRLKSFYGGEELLILREFSDMLNKVMSDASWQLCAHNGKEFDFPYLGRRFIINGLKLPAALDLQGKKPWEVRLEDTMQLWKFGDYKSYTSLDLLTAVLSIPTPKDDMDGSMVGKVFWEDKDYKRIAKYCTQDVVATAQVMLRFCGLPLIEPGAIEHV